VALEKGLRLPQKRYRSRHFLALPGREAQMVRPVHPGPKVLGRGDAGEFPEFVG
jgi:hypothetical protein